MHYIAWIYFILLNVFIYEYSFAKQLAIYGFVIYVHKS